MAVLSNDSDCYLVFGEVLRYDARGQSNVSASVIAHNLEMDPSDVVACVEALGDKGLVHYVSDGYFCVCGVSAEGLDLVNGIRYEFN